MSRLLLLAALFASPAARADDAAQAKAVREALAAVTPALHRCWEQSAAADYRVEGQIELKVTVGKGGKVARVELKGTTMGREDLEACAQQAFRETTFGSAFADGDSLELPVTFKSEPNVTLRRDYAPNIVRGPRVTLRILVDELTAAATQASMVLVDLRAGGTWRPPCCGGARVYVLGGRVKAGAETLGLGDVLLYDADSRTPELRALPRSELLLVLAPPGAEKAYRTNAAEARPASQAPARVVRQAEAGQYVVTFEAGARLAEHAHAQQAELLYVLAGSGEITVDGEKYPVEAHMAVHVPAGARHSFVAQSAVKAVQFYAPERLK